MPDFRSYILLEYPGGGVEFALPLDESARPLCILASRAYKQGRKKTARSIFIFLLTKSVSAALKKKLKFFTVSELAELAAALLNAKYRKESPPVPLPPETLRQAAEKLRRIYLQTQQEK